MNRDAVREGLVLEALRSVMDPELGCNIVDLGLIYQVDIQGNRVRIRMTATTPGCPMVQSLVDGVHAAISRLEAVDEVDVQLVWDPPWRPAMMTEAGRNLTGLRS